MKRACTVELGKIGELAKESTKKRSRSESRRYSYRKEKDNSQQVLCPYAEYAAADENALRPLTMTILHPPEMSTVLKSRHIQNRPISST